MPPKPRIAFAWFTSETFAETKRLGATDLQDRFETWLEKSERGLAELAAQGDVVEKVMINPAALAAFCRKLGWLNDRRDRAQFAAFILDQESQRRH